MSEPAHAPARSDTAARVAAGGGVGTALAGLAQLLPQPWSAAGSVIAPGVGFTAHWGVGLWLKRINYANNVKWIGIARAKLETIANDPQASDAHRAEAREQIAALNRTEVALALNQVNVEIRVAEERA